MTASMHPDRRRVDPVGEIKGLDDANPCKTLEDAEHRRTIDKTLGNVLLAVLAARQFDIVERGLGPEFPVGQFLKPVLNILTVFESMHADSMPERPSFAQI